LLRRRAPSQCNQFCRDVSTGALNGNGLLQFARRFRLIARKSVLAPQDEYATCINASVSHICNRLRTHHKTSLTLPTTFKIDFIGRASCEGAVQIQIEIISLYAHAEAKE
jgi:hypothetical protein